MTFRYVECNTYATPIAGGHGLRPRQDHTVEQWGPRNCKVALTACIKNMANYAAWAAVRAIGELNAHQQNTPAGVKRIVVRQICVAAFKGRPLSFRTWNGQMRQPIPVVASGALVSQAQLISTNEMNLIHLA